jgi:excisionase family DNA binding protein
MSASNGTASLNGQESVTSESGSADTTAGRLLTPDELATRWQVPKAHVYRLTRECRLPTVRLGRYYRYRVAAI